MTVTKSPQPACPDRERTLRLVRAREAEELSREDLRLLRSHLSACGECRDTALSLDPTLLFAPLAGAAGDGAPGEGRKMAAGVLAVLEAQRIDRRMGRRRFAPDRPVLKAAALLLVGAGLAGLVAMHPWRSDPTVAAHSLAGTTAGPLPSAASAPFIETVDGPGVKVYQFAADAPGQAAVVFVVDRNVDL